MGYVLLFLKEFFKSLIFAFYHCTRMGVCKNLVYNKWQYVTHSSILCSIIYLYLIFFSYNIKCFLAHYSLNHLYLYYIITYTSRRVYKNLIYNKWHYVALYSSILCSVIYLYLIFFHTILIGTFSQIN